MCRLISLCFAFYGKPNIRPTADPLNPHFYTVKLRFTGVYVIFPISAFIIDRGYLLELPQHRLCVSLEPPRHTYNLCFQQKYDKQQFLTENFHFLV